MEAILNLTGKPATEEMKKAGVIDPDGLEMKEIIDNLKFDGCPDFMTINSQARDIAYILMDYMDDVDYALLDCPSFMVHTLESRIRKLNIAPIYEWKVNGEHRGFIGL